MSNRFTDFFETLLPREITVYVIPGSLVLSTILWRYNFYNRPVNCKLDSTTATYFDKVLCNHNAASYTILTIIWISIAYTIGLIIGAIKEGILYRFIKRYATGLKSFFDKNGKENKKEKENNDEEIYFSAMYISLYQKTMYRREIERYGVFANSLDNLAIAMGFVILLIVIKPVAVTNKILMVHISSFLLLILPIGAEGYRKLQRNRIRYLKKAIDAQPFLEPQND